MRTMTDTFQAAVRSLQKTNIIQATITDNIPTWNTFTGTAVPGGGSLYSTASARNVNFSAGAVSGSATGTKVLTVALTQDSVNHVVKLYSRVETDFVAFSNINTWALAWTGSTHIINTSNTPLAPGNSLTVFYHETLDRWVVAWFAFDRTTNSNLIHSMYSTNDGTTWSNWDGAATPILANLSGTYGADTPASVSLAFFLKDMSLLGYAGLDVGLLIAADKAIVTGSGSAGDGSSIFISHHLGTYWDIITYQWNNGPIFSVTDIAATYVSGYGEVDIVFTGARDKITIAGGGTHSLFSCMWNGEVAPSSFGPIITLASRDLVAASSYILPYEHVSLNRTVYSGDPLVRWYMSLLYIQTNTDGSLLYQELWYKSANWGDWSEPHYITSVAGSRYDVFYDNVTGRYVQFGSPICRNTNVPITADITNDIISYERINQASGNADTITLVVNNIDPTTAGSLWFSELGDPTPTNTNLVTNPTLTINTTGWNAFNCTIARDTTTGYNSSLSLKITNNTGGGAYTPITYVAGTTYTAQARIKGTPGDRIYFAAQSNGTSNNFYLTGQWDLLSWTFTPTTTTSTIEVKGDAPGQLYITTNYWIDQVMVEANATASQYFDGSLAGGQYAWTGTANASTSTYSANYRPRVGTNAAAVKKNALLILKEGFVTSLGNETIQVGQYYIDDIQPVNNPDSLTLNIDGRDIHKKLRDFRVTNNLNWQSQLRFRDDFSAGYITPDWSTPQIPGVTGNNVQWTEAGGLMTSPAAPETIATFLTYNSANPIGDGAIEFTVQSDGWTLNNPTGGVIFRLATTNGIMTTYGLEIDGIEAHIMYYTSADNSIHYINDGYIFPGVGLNTGVNYFFKVTFSQTGAMAYWSTDHLTWTTMWDTPVVLTALTQSTGSVGLWGFGAFDISFADFIVYTNDLDQGAESVSKNIAAHAGLFDTTYGSTYLNAFQNQLLNPSFESVSSTATAATVPSVGATDTSIGTNPWATPGNIFASDNAYATSTIAASSVATNRLWAQGFGFNIPINAIVTGITATIERSVAPFSDQPIPTDSSNFENAGAGVASWTALSSATLARDTGTVHAGTGSLKITYGGIPGAGAAFSSYSPSYVGQTQTVSLWMFSATLVGFTLSILNGTVSIGSTTVTATGAWQQITATGTAVSLSAITINIIKVGSNPTSFFIDDVVGTRSSTYSSNLMPLDSAGFENAAAGVAGWSTIDGNATLSRETTIVHTGTGSLKSVNNGASNTGPRFISAITPTFVGQLYSLTFWINLTSGISFALQVFNHASVFTTTLALNYTNPAQFFGTGGWSQVTVTFAATTTSQPFTIFVFTGTGTAYTLYLDDIFVLTPNVYDNEVSLLKAGAIYGTNKALGAPAVGANWPSTDTVATYGSGSDLWGGSFAPADINASTFGVSLAATTQAQSGAVLNVDQVKMTINYALPAAGTTSWTKTDSGSCTSVFTADSTTASSDSGSVSGKIAITAAPNATASNIEVKQTTLSLTNTKTYILSFYAKGDVARTIQAAMTNSANSLNYLSPQTLTLSAYWQRFSFKFTASATDATAVLRFFLNNGTLGTVWIDGVQLESLAVGDARTDPSKFLAVTDQIGTLIGSGSSALVNGQLFGDALAVKGTTSTYAYIPMLTAQPADFRADFNTKITQSGLSGTAGRFVYRNNAPQELENGYVLEYGTATQGGAWYSTNYQYRVKITTNGAQFGDFTLMGGFGYFFDLRLAGGTLFKVTRSDGADIIVTDANQNKLPRDLEMFSQTNLTGQLYFTQDPTSRINVFYIYFGYASGSETNSTSAFSANYKGVYHLDGTTTATYPVDSKGGNTMTLQTTGAAWANNTESTTGKIGNAVQFVSSNRYMDFSTNLGMAQYNVGMECIVQIPTTSCSGAFMSIGQDTGGSFGYALGIGSGTFNSTGNELVMLYMGVRWIATGIHITAGVPHYLAMTIDAAGGAYINVDGVATGPFTGSLPITPTAGAAIGGTHGGLYTLASSSGAIWVDEAHFWNNFLYGAASTTTYNMDSSNSSFWIRNALESYSYTNWELKRLDSGVPTLIGGTVNNSYQMTSSTSTSTDKWNRISVIANGPWHTIMANGRIIITVYDSTYLSSSTGTGYIILGGGLSTLFTYFDEIRLPQLWQPIPQLVFSTTDDGLDVFNDLIDSTGSVYISSAVGGLKIRKLLLLDPIVWEFTPGNFYTNQYTVSDKEAVNDTVVYGYLRANVETIDYANWLETGVHRPLVDTDEKLTNISAISDSSSLLLQSSKQFLTQPDPTLAGHPGAEVYDVVKISDTIIGIVPTGYRINNIQTDFIAEANSLIQELGVGKVIGL